MSAILVALLETIRSLSFSGSRRNYGWRPSSEPNKAQLWEYSDDDGSNYCRHIATVTHDGASITRLICFNSGAPLPSERNLYGHLEWLVKYVDSDADIVVLPDETAVGNPLVQVYSNYLLLDYQCDDEPPYEDSYSDLVGEFVYDARLNSLTVQS